MTHHNLLQMKGASILRYLLAIGLLICSYSIDLGAQAGPVGLWKTIDDSTGEAKSHVEIYEENGLLYGKVRHLLLKPNDTVCKQCTGDKKNQPVVGMIILQDMKPNKSYWQGGTIMDPENGKSYKCKIYLEGDNKLKVRGYIGFEALGRNQFWERI